MAFSGIANASFLDAVVNTLPGGYAGSSDDFFSNQGDGVSKILKEGNTGLVVSAYTNHPAWDYDNRTEENAYPFGGGICRSVIDEDGNERLLFAVAFSDSHYKPEPIIGYSWIARHNVSENFHLGAGYVLGVTFRADYQWLPIPTPLPVINAGVSGADLYMTFIPFSNVFYFYTKFTTDNKEFRFFPLASDAKFGQRNEWYVAGTYVNTDVDNEDGWTATSDAGGMIGYRRFLNDNWAIDVNYTQSKHEVQLRGQKQDKWKMSAVSAAAQYHFQMSEAVRAHAGAGIGYAKVKCDDCNRDSTSVYPVIQTGLTWAPTEHSRVLGGINVNFPRFKNVIDAEDSRFRPSPVQFYLGAGFAF